MTKLSSDSFRQVDLHQSKPRAGSCGVITGQLVKVIVSLSNTVLLLLFSFSLSVFICLYWFTSGELPSASVSSQVLFVGWSKTAHSLPPKLPTSSQFYCQKTGKSSASEINTIEFHALGSNNSGEKSITCYQPQPRLCVGVWVCMCVHAQWNSSFLTFQSCMGVLGSYINKIYLSCL